MTRKTDVGVPDAVEVIGHYLPLEDRGKRGFQGYCPFCSRIEGTLFVRRDLQEWHCFGCGTGGDVYDFVARIEGLVRVDAIASLARRYGVPRDTRPESREETPVAAMPAVAEPAVAAEPARAEPGPAPSESAAVDRYEPLFHQLRKIGTYQGAAVLDASAAVLAIDPEFPDGLDFVGLGKTIDEVFAAAASILKGAGEVQEGPSVFTLTAAMGAVLAMKVGEGPQARFLLKRIGDPAIVVSARMRMLNAAKFFA